MNLIEAWDDSWGFYVVSISNIKSDGRIPVRPILRISCWIMWYKINKE